MEYNHASFTAMGMAYLRAYHSIYDEQKIFDDYLAYDLIPEDKRALIEQYIASWDKQSNIYKHEYSLSNHRNTSLILIQEINNAVSCARYAEDKLEKALRQGIKQYVILGAGMDTFAFRCPEVMDCLEVFEVDHPATQDFKLLRLAELGWKFPEKLHFIPIDFTKEDLLTVLPCSSAYDQKVKSFFNWLGVTCYLTQDEVLATLHSISKIAPKGSMVVFDYLDTNSFIPGKIDPQMRTSLEFLQNIGEPIKMGSFNPLMLAEDLASLGLYLQENLSSADIEERYLKGRMGGIDEDVHIACAVVE